MFQNKGPEGREPPSGEPPSGVSTIVKEILTNYKAALGLIGLAVYAIVRVAHDSFYSEFNLTPESVGLSQIIILSRAALYFGLLLSVVLALGGAWALLWYVVTQTWRFLHRHIFLRIRAFLSHEQFTMPSRHRYHSHQPLMIMFFLAAPLPLLIIYAAPYFVRFLFLQSDRLPEMTLGWTLLLWLALYWALRLARFNHNSLRVVAAVVLLTFILFIPLALSIMTLKPNERPYATLLSSVHILRLEKLDSLHIYPLERFRDKVQGFDPKSGSTLVSALRPLQVALLIWAGSLGVPAQQRFLARASPPRSVMLTPAR